VGGKATSVGVFNNLGVALLNLGEKEQARQAFSEAKHRAPTELDSHKNLAMLSAQDGDHTAAVDIMNNAVALQPTNGGAWKLLGQLNAESQRGLEAQQAYARALALDPADAQARSALDQLDASLGSSASDLPPPAQEARSLVPPTTDIRVTGTDADVQFLQGVIQQATAAQKAGDYVKSSQLWATATRTQPDQLQGSNVRWACHARVPALR
jgi:Flp pilus assembly protein TadD